MLEITQATMPDAPAITALANRLAITTLSSADLGNGFLVSAYGQEEYEYWIPRTPYFLLARYSGVLVGFVLAYPYTEIVPEDRFNREARAVFLADLSDTTLVLAKQAAVAPEARRHGVARSLYQNIYAILHSGATMFGAIVEEPRNPASESFHIALGWKRLGSLANPDGRPRGIWARFSHPSNSNAPRS